MSAIEIRTLEAVPADQLLESHNRAFSDYAVPFQLTPEQFAVIQRQNGVQLDASFGAFDGPQLIGIWLNGLRMVEGVPYAYDAGTAIWPEYRGQGISSRLAEASNRLLEQRGVQRYRLEVLTENEKAFRLYEKSGFQIRRKLICLSRRRDAVVTRVSNSELILGDAPLSAVRAAELPAMEYEPSWQNSWEAMTAIADDVRLVMARRGDRIVGYGILKPARGTITQIGWFPEYEHPAAPLLIDLIAELAQGDMVRVLNIDERALRTLDVFAHRGFELMVTQHEMEKPLGPAPSA
jgi:ribosomal protein S18 acetylase RimI-like enzyme